jgi:hypothetical protein
VELVAADRPAPAHRAAIAYGPPSLPALALGDRRGGGSVWHLFF